MTMAVDMRLTSEGFSLSHAAILDGDTGIEESDGDIYGINEGSFEPNVDQYENEGDDTVLSIWQWMNYADISIQGGYVPFKLIALLTGETITSSGTSENDWYDIEPWTDRAMNTAARPMWMRMEARDADGDPRYLSIVVYKVFFAPITFDGPRYKDGLKINYAGRAVMSDVDEAGSALSSYRSVGRLVSHPTATGFAHP